MDYKCVLVTGGIGLFGKTMLRNLLDSFVDEARVLRHGDEEK